MASHAQVDRRTLVKAAGIGAAAAFTQSVAWVRAGETAKVNGNIKQSVCRWCYSKTPLEKLAAEARRIGYRSIELLSPKELEVVKPLGLTCAVLSGACTIPDGFNRKENHDRLEKSVREHIEIASANGLPNVIVFSGNRRGMPDDEGLANCTEGLKRVVGFAEEKKVTIIMELLNSKVDHKDYMCDRSPWGVKLVNAVGSPRFKLLYDIYHMQIMEGDVIRNIREHAAAIAHYHTAGVPGRHEIDAGQELNYPAICRAIVDTGFSGFLAQEFVPTGDPLKAFEEAFRICDV